MEIIAQTSTGFIINATKAEVEVILQAVTGVKPEKISIGQKVPAIDYASTITKIKSLKDDNNFRYLKDYASKFQKEIETLTQVVDSASNINI